MGWWGTGAGLRALLVAAVAVPALAAPAVQAADALAKLERGRWLIRSTEQGPVERSVCLGDPALLFQIEHGSHGCAQQVVRRDDSGATVEYVCPGRGFGHTSIRVETSKQAMIDTQGFRDGRPFAYRATARKLSDC